MIHLDTHVLVWIAAGQHHRIPATLRRRLPGLPVVLSPMVLVELQFLHEIGRITEPATELLDLLRRRLDLRLSETPFHLVAHRALALDWTRDPFDRFIAASALVDDLPLLTADEHLLAHCATACWDDWA